MVNVKRHFEFCSYFVPVICFCFILLSRNDSGALYRTKPHLLSSFSALKESIRKKQRLKGGESSSQFRWFTIAKIKL